MKKNYNQSIAEYYDQYLQKNNISDYEFYRWHSDEIKQTAYQMTEQGISDHLIKIKCNNCLEVGAGNGVWTGLLLKFFPNSKFDLVDISNEMLAGARNKLGDNSNIKYILNDVESFKSNNKYDLFFSIRSLEYWNDKAKALKNIYDLLDTNGSGLVITKQPHYFRSKLFGQRVSSFHQKQISPRDLKNLLIECGFKNIYFKPVVVNVPFVKSPRINLLVYKLTKCIKFYWLFSLITESYIITFNKK